MARRDPWMPLYVSDWNESLSVKRMSLAERGLYIELIMLEWRAGFVPDDIKLVARAIGCDAREIRYSWPRVREQFQEQSEGKLVSSRVQSELEMRAIMSQAALESANRRQGACTSRARASGSGSGSSEVLSNKLPTGEESEKPVSASPPRPAAEPAANPPRTQPEAKPHTSPSPSTAVARRDDTLDEFLGLYLQLGVEMCESDLRKCSLQWISLDWADQWAAMTWSRTQFPEWQTCATRFIPRPWNVLQQRLFERRGAVAPRMRSMTAAERGQNEAARMFMAG